MSKSVDSTFTVKSALTQLLGGTGLRFEYLDAKTIWLRATRVSLTTFNVLNTRPPFTFNYLPGNAVPDSRMRRHSVSVVRDFQQISDENMRHYKKTRAGNLDARKIAAAFEAQRRKTIADSLAVLTPGQSAAWQAMNGPAFRVDTNLGIVLSGPTPGAQPKEKPPLAAGTTAPDFEARTADGKAARLSDYRGKVVVLDFWATWCDPCLAGLPNLEETARRTQGQEIDFLALNVWDKEPAFRKWARINHELTVHLLRDPAGETRGQGVGALYNVSGIPTTYVIDREGKVVGTPKSEPVARHMGGLSHPISTSGVPDREMVELLGKLGIRVN